MIPFGTHGPEQLDPKWSPAVRRALLRLGYSPTPTNGKAPVLPDWQNLHVTEADIAKWKTTCPSARNTGILTARTPCVDIDVLDSEMAHKIHATLVAPLIGEGYPKLCRAGLPPRWRFLFALSNLSRKLRRRDTSARMGKSIALKCSGPDNSL